MQISTAVSEKGLYEYPDFSLEIKRGAMFLDEVAPGWRSRVNPAILQLSHTTYCVCGQVFSGHYSEGMTRLSTYVGTQIDAEIPGPGQVQAAHHGFIVLSPLDIECNYDAYVEYGTEPDVFLEEAERFTKVLWAWGEGYVEGDEDPNIHAACYSALTEQWISYINQTR